MSYRIILSAVAALTICASTALSQEVKSITPSKAAVGEGQNKVEGWTPKLRFSAGFIWGSNQSVIGQPNGDSVTLNGTVEGAYNYHLGLTDWTNTLTFNGATSKTPGLNGFVKTADDLSFRSLYLRSLPSYTWLGPYVQFLAKTSVFKGEAVSAGVTNYTGPGASTSSTDRLRLTDGFSPLDLRLSAGVFADLWENTTNKLTGRLGLGYVNVLADDQFALDGTTIVPLGDYDYLGLEAGLELNGTFDEKTTYRASAIAVYPFSVDDAVNPKDLSGFELTEVQVDFVVGSKLYEWLALEWKTRIVNQPILINDWQIHHGLSLNFTHTLF